MAGEDEGGGAAKGGFLNPKGRFPRKAASSLRLSGLAGGAFQTEENICKGRVGRPTTPWRRRPSLQSESRVQKEA